MLPMNVSMSSIEIRHPKQSTRSTRSGTFLNSFGDGWLINGLTVDKEPKGVGSTIDDIRRRNVDGTVQLHDVNAAFVVLCDLYDFWNTIAAVVSHGSRRKECEASSDESASQVPLLELVGDHHSARFPHSVRTTMIPW